MTARLAVLVSGNGTNLQAILDACAGLRLDAEVVVVLSNRKAAYALERAAVSGVPTVYLPLRPFLDTGAGRHDYDAELARVIAGYRPDWVVLAGWMHVLSSEFLDRFANRVVNLHPALPGAFPGADAIGDAWEAYQRGDVDRTGVMVHLVPDESVDSGPVVGSVEVPIFADDSRETLEVRIHTAEHDLLIDCLARLAHSDKATANADARPAALPEASP